MATHTIFGSSAPPETQAVYVELPRIQCATSFYLNQDRTGWQCTGGRYYVDPSLVDDMSGRAVRISVGNDTGTAISTAEIYPLVAGWNEVTWSTPLNISPVKSPFWIWSEVLTGPGASTGDGTFLAFNPPYPPKVVSPTTPLFEQAAMGDAPARAAYSIGDSGSWPSNPASNFYSMDAIVTAPNEAPTITVASSMSELRITDTATLTATVVDDEPGSTVAWSVLSGPSTSSSQLSATSGTSTVFDPTALGTYVIRAVATDIHGATATRDTTLPVITPSQLVVNAPGNALRVKLSNHTFTATTTNGFGPKAYAWTLVSGNPANVTLTNTSSATVTFQASLTGTYTLRCTVTDTLYTAFDEISILVTELPPPASAYYLYDGEFWIPQHVDFL